MRRRNRFGGFGGGFSPTIIKRRDVPACPYKRQRCSGCQGFILFGEPAVRLQLAKRHRHACSSCGNDPKGSRWFHAPNPTTGHAGCVPVDPEKAMGYDPGGNIPKPKCSHGIELSSGLCRLCNPNIQYREKPGPAGGVAPPPKPKTFDALRLECLVDLEVALKAGLQQRHIAKTPALTKQFDTLKNIKERISRPGTPAEGENATNVALKKLIDIVFCDKPV